MAAEANTSGFGKRAIHRVWSDRLDNAVYVSMSPLRCWLAITLFALLAILFLRASILIAADPPGWLSPVPPPASFILALLLAGAGALALWTALRIVASMLRPGPVFRLDPSRIVLRTGQGHIVLAWEDVTLSLGRLFFRLQIRSFYRLGGTAGGASEILVPVMLLRGGRTELVEAIGRLRPDALPGR